MSKKFASKWKYAKKVPLFTPLRSSNIALSESNRFVPLASKNVFNTPNNHSLPATIQFIFWVWGRILTKMLLRSFYFFRTCKSNVGGDRFFDQSCPKTVIFCIFKKKCSTYLQKRSSKVFNTNYIGYIKI